MAVGQMDDGVIASVGDGQAIALGLDGLLTRGLEKNVNEGEDLTDTNDAGAKAAQRLLRTREALIAGRLKVGAEYRRLAEELMSAPLTMVGLVETAGLSDEALSFGRTAGLAVNHIHEGQEEKQLQRESMSMAEAQSELFRLFGQLFSALSGRAIGNPPNFH